MPSQTLPPIAMTGEWIDLAVTTGYTAVASADVSIISENAYGARALFGTSGTAPTDEHAGMFLPEPGDGCRGTAAHVWVKGTAGQYLTANLEA
jgi:hypothetical protein